MRSSRASCEAVDEREEVEAGGEEEEGDEAEAEVEAETATAAMEASEEVEMGASSSMSSAFVVSSEAVRPLPSLACRSAPLEMSSLVRATLPASAAVCSAVRRPF